MKDDLCSKVLAFRGLALSHGSDPSHEENVMFIFEEFRTLHFNQLTKEDF
ncbi:hypothetical protein [Fictibacillus enclensis]|nr:hypothetical protein [Fictibacillus enclensis]